MSSDAKQLLPYLYGLQPPPLVNCLGAQVQPALVPSLTAMAHAAQAAGFQLRIASGHRDFARQLHIFNGKARGHRPLLDSDGEPLKAESLVPDALLAAILRWSALPGASRHHWGTEVDVYDASVCGDGYALALTVAECQGIMAPFHAWLTDYLASQTAFERPYLRDRGGVAPEPWHLSYVALAHRCAESFSCAGLRKVLVSADIALKPLILEQLADLVERYVDL